MRGKTGMRTAIISLVALVAAHATTLQKLSTDQMILQSTAIVRATVTGSYTVARGQDLFTYYRFQVAETLKAGPSAITELAVPGGSLNGIRQLAPGAPSLKMGGDYVIFLWTGRSGVTQVIGLSQGLFSVMQNDSNEMVLVRGPSEALMLDAQGRVINDQSITMKLSDLRTQIHKDLAK
jgi:hypothetical protein